MIRTLDRYLLKSFFANYGISLFVLVSLYVVLDLFVNLDEFTEGGKGPTRVAADVANYYFYNLPLYFAQLSGVITAFAACGTLARLQRLNEMTAVLASGTSLYRLAAPIVFAGLFMNGLLVFNSEVVLPGVAPKLARERDDVAGSRVYELWFIKDGDHRLISAQQFSPSLGTIRGLIVLERAVGPDGPGQLASVITADKAVWSEIRQGWELARGIHYHAGQQAGNLTDYHLMPPEPLDFYPCTLRPEELRLRQTAAWIGFLSTSQLNQLASRGDVKPERIAGVKHARFTQPISNMLLLLLGMVFFLNRLPSSVITQGGKALAMCGVAFLINFAAQSLAGMAGIHPALPAWIPVFLFAPLAVLLLDSVRT